MRATARPDAPPTVPRTARAAARGPASAPQPPPPGGDGPGGRSADGDRITAVRLHTVPVTPRTTWLLAEARGADGTTGWGELSDLPCGDPAALLAELAAQVTGVPWAEAVVWLDTYGQHWASAPPTRQARLARRTALGGLATAVADAAARRAGLTLGDWTLRADTAVPAAASSPDSAASPASTRTPAPTAIPTPAPTATQTPTPAPAAPLPLSAPAVEPVVEPASASAGEPRSVPLYANINRAMAARTPEAAAQVAARAVAAGFRAVKCAPFDGLPARDRLAAGLDIARAVRDTVGDGTDLLLDAHHLVTVADVLARAEDFTALRLGWLEDAARLDDVTGLRRLRDALGIPLAGGEFAGTAREVLPALRSGALDVLMPDVKHAGGPLPALRLARLARDHGAGVSFHNPSGPVATAATAHLTALTGSGLPLEVMFGEADWRPGWSSPPEPLAAGRYTLPPGPGSGLVPDGARPTPAPAPAARTQTQTETR
ncbi:enolase C-terminal domain-like protein [Streptomyces sp. NPDC006134]|uniref:enolase C-terminal domain-like protein n=1 Tax=Streptomyces sp. NPDC006134 TaxID=3154467 RepID=UPI00340657F5